MRRRKKKKKFFKPETLKDVLGSDKNFICTSCGNIDTISSLDLAKLNCYNRSIECSVCSKNMRRLLCKLK
jgi:transcription elongation factor Elf1